MTIEYEHPNGGAWKKRFGNPDEIRKLRGYSVDTAKKPKPEKKRKPKLKLVKGGR